MYKIAITGKANSGKNTVARIIKKEMRKNIRGIFCKYIAFADPIKRMIRIMFPELPEKCLTGPSKYRSEIIPGAFNKGIPLTVRQVLIDLGTQGRQYNENIWLDAFDLTFQKAQSKNMIIVTDCRFRNEFEHLKKMKFFQIKLLRNNDSDIKHESETNQDTIKDDEFNCVIDNNGTLKDLQKKIRNIIPLLK